MNVHPFDANGDGSSAGESGISGVTVDLIDCGAGTCSDGDESVAGTQTTNANGAYDFTGLPAGNYKVVVTDSNQVLGGLTASYTPTQPVTIVCSASCSEIDTVDFGYKPTVGGGVSTLGGTVWHDTLTPGGVEGTLQAGEPCIQGWRVYIGGYIEGLPLFITSVLTDANGYFSFADLTAGTWYIAEDIARDVPAETFWNQTYPNGGSALVPPVATPLLSSGIPFFFPGSPTLGPWAYRVDLTATNLTQHNVNFGNVGKGCLTITKSLSIPVGVPLGPLDGSFVINVANVTYGFSQNVSFTMVNGVITSTNPVADRATGDRAGTVAANQRRVTAGVALV